MADRVCRSLGGSLIPRLHLTTLLRRLGLQTNLYCADSGSKRTSTAQTRAPNESLLHRLWLQTNLYCADSGSKQISTAQTRAPNDVIYSRWQRPYWDDLPSLFYSGRKRRCGVHLFCSLWHRRALQSHSFHWNHKIKCTHTCPCLWYTITDECIWFKKKKHRRCDMLNTIYNLSIYQVAITVLKNLLLF